MMSAGKSGSTLCVSSLIPALTLPVVTVGRVPSIRDVDSEPCTSIATDSVLVVIPSSHASFVDDPIPTTFRTQSLQPSPATSFLVV